MCTRSCVLRPFEADPYLTFVRRIGQPVLELGCGDDGPFLELLRQRIDIEGVDSSPDMVERCSAQAAAEGLNVVVHLQTMQDLRLPRSYQAIFLAGPTFNLLPDAATAFRALQGIAQHLRPTGQAMVPLWIPGPTPAQEIGRTRETVTKDGATARSTIDSEEYDAASRIRRTTIDFELRTGQRLEHVRRDWVIHWHTPEGFAQLAREAGLEAIRTDPIVSGEFTVYLQHSGASR